MQKLSFDLEHLISDRKEEFSKRLLAWWEQNKRTYPWRVKSVSPYQVLVAEILLKRTTATAASKIFIEFLKKYKDIKSVSEADIRSLEKILLSVGLHKQRAKGLKEIAHYICEKKNCKIPNNIQELLEIPHIGDYTSRAILSFAYNIPTGIVDSNVIRVINRVFFAGNPIKVSPSLNQSIVEKLLPQNKHKEFNWAILDFGALVCRYSYPQHKVCPLFEICSFPNKNSS